MQDHQALSVMSNFGVQLLLWSCMVTTSALTWFLYRRLREKEARLPKACELESIDSIIQTRQQVLADLDAKLVDAQQLLAQREQAHAQVEQAYKWFAENRDELLKMEGERQRQEVLRQELIDDQNKTSTQQILLRQLQEQLAETEAKLRTNRDEVERWQKTLDQLTPELKMMEENRSGIVQMIQELQSEKINLEREMGRIEADKIREQADFEKVSLSLDAAEEKYADLDEQLAKAESLLRTSRDEFERLQKNLEQLYPELKMMEENRSGIVQMMQELQSEKIRLEREIEAIEANKIRKQADCEKVLLSLEDIEKKRAVVAGELAVIRKEAAVESVKLTGLKAEQEAFIKSIESLKYIAEGLSKELSKTTHGSDEERYRDLWMPAVKPLKPAVKVVTEQDALKQTSRYINDLGLKFSERVLFAFHTALKINDISPLVVLAGISGTGKSELPRRYAEGMGMHVVMLAVQPRWDSPQDLFGFYNYLEKRYKATELARAMVQFERHNRNQWTSMPKGWKEGCEDRMLVVLLDEMNLARVEYYFSEFLSKLEARRGILLNSPNNLEKAEISIEMGSLGTNEKIIRLFPDQNVLFTGTMNEDESTQSLSDKVLDRACVLRFGRPVTAVTRSSQNVAVPQSEGLLFKTWSTWIAVNVHDKQVAEWITRLNDIMEKIHRPFGHRVAQAIQAYVANYPKWAPGDRRKTAMADQIEQRIMPKLRGLDVEENRIALDSIKQFIAELEDDKLLAAVKTGYEGQSAFIWRGIDRNED